MEDLWDIEMKTTAYSAGRRLEHFSINPIGMLVTLMCLNRCLLSEKEEGKNLRERHVVDWQLAIHYASTTSSFGIRQATWSEGELVFSTPSLGETRSYCTSVHLCHPSFVEFGDFWAWRVAGPARVDSCTRHPPECIWSALLIKQKNN